ncbi:MAG: LysE family transporter [Dehalococcoidales bacterium]
MFALLLTVVGTSLSGVIAPGPMFAVTITKSFKSPWAGTLMALGHAVVEVPLIILLYFGLSHFFENTVVQFVFSILGGGVLIWLAIGLLKTPNEIKDGGRDIRYGAFTAGIIMTGLNPFFIMWWVTVGVLLLIKFMAYWEIVAVGLTVFIIAHWFCDLIWLSFVSAVVYKTHNMWGATVQALVFIVAGLLMVGFGGWFIISGFRLLF